jgi:ComEC/Rec2-related protein
MRVEREIAGVALPFAFGAASFLYAGDFLATYQYGTAAASICAASTLLFVLLYLLTHNKTKATTWIAVIMVMTACGIMTAATSSVLSVSSRSDGGWLGSVALGFGDRMKGAIDSIPFRYERTGQVVKALLTGDRKGMSPEITQAFRNSGASHILALSGLHLGIIYGMIHFMTRGLGNSKPSQAIRSLSLVSICGFYMLATGAGASIVRAFIFIVIGECIRLSGRQSILKNTTMTALIIHLAIMPSAIKEVGFQLSYAAIFGIAFIFPWMQGFWPGDRHEDGRFTRCTRWIWDSAAMSISCQITTAPLAYMYFGTFPTQFILTNLIALPLTGIIIPCSLTTLTASMLGWHPQILLDITEWMISLLCGSLDLLSTM